MEEEVIGFDWEELEEEPMDSGWPIIGKTMLYFSS